LLADEEMKDIIVSPPPRCVPQATKPSLHLVACLKQRNPPNALLRASCNETLPPPRCVPHATKLTEKPHANMSKTPMFL
jgi:hypothetical protein